LLYICIPAYNEGPTIGVLLWRIRKVFQAYSREYEIVVYDDGSTDETRDRLLPYAEIAPLTVLHGETRQGYAHALDRLCREVSRRTRYPRRDAMILMQGDFTDQPEHLPELVKRFEGGADIVVSEREAGKAPASVRRLLTLAPWTLKFFVDIQGVAIRSTDSDCTAFHCSATSSNRWARSPSLQVRDGRPTSSCS
jgi:glycosyltransferase involved in cell wall biosynthesis